MSEPERTPGREVKPEGEDAYVLAENWLNEPMIIATGVCIFVLCILVFEAPAIYDAIAALFPH